jgi:hypothetical protein
MAVGNGNNLRNERGKRLHISQQLTDEQILNSPGVKAVRQQMIRGEWPAACERCRQIEQAGSPSIRQQLNSKLGQDQEMLLSRTREDGSLDRPIVRYADIRLGNTCNLTCRMCGPGASRLWASHFNDVQPAAYRVPARELAILGENNWVKTQSLGWLLEQCLPSVERLHFAGGEPLIVPEMVDALEQCVRSGRANEIELSYNTNLTVLPDKVTALWPHFNGVTLLCSVDGYGRMNDYIRRPSHWSDIDRNLRALDRHFDEWKIRWATVSTTVQIYNVLTIHELFAYMRTAGFARVTPIPQVVPLFDPRYLSIQGLPAQAKIIARERLRMEIQRAEAWNLPGLAGLIGSVNTTIAFMDAADTSAHLPDFLSFCTATDGVFGDSWRAAAPDLAAHLDAVKETPSQRLSQLQTRVRQMLDRRA